MDQNKYLFPKHFNDGFYYATINDKVIKIRF